MKTKNDKTQSQRRKNRLVSLVLALVQSVIGFNSVSRTAAHKTAQFHWIGRTERTILLRNLDPFQPGLFLDPFSLNGSDRTDPSLFWTRSVWTGPTGPTHL